MTRLSFVACLSAVKKSTTQNSHTDLIKVEISFTLDEILLSTTVNSLRWFTLILFQNPPTIH